MKKSKKKAARPHKKRATAEKAAPNQTERRSFLQTFGLGTCGLALAGVGGWWVSSSIQAHTREQDLARVGRGVPSIVQVHDPQCSDCTVLQRETRQALKCFDDDELVYVVASLTTDAGRIFADQFGAGRVTLLLFDASGRMRNVVQGIHDHDELKAMFTSHIA